jgi:ABC-2 type transport system ATP-binding protein
MRCVMASQVVVRDLRKRYGDVEAVRGVSFDVAEGEILGLLGPNGAGKTSALECVIGLRRPDSGTIQIGGVDAVAHPDWVKQSLGAQLQATALQDKITPREAIALFASFYDDPADADELIERFQLGEKQDATFDTLSGGQRQRLALALAFVNKPRVLFLDEPTTGLDPQSRRELHESIRRMRQERRTVLLTTHYIEEAQQLCDRIAIIDHGRVIATGTPDSLIARSKTLSVLEFQTSRPIDERRLAVLPGASDVVWRKDRCSLRTGTVGACLIELVRLLEAQGAELVDLQLRKPTLEDVFIELTGSSLRD